MMISRGANLATWAHAAGGSFLFCPRPARLLTPSLNLNNVIGRPSSFDDLVCQAHILEREPEVDHTRIPDVICIQSALPVQPCVCIPRTTTELPIYGPLPRAVVVTPPSPEVHQQDGQLA